MKSFINMFIYNWFSSLNIHPHHITTLLHFQMKTVSDNLEPGTARNITLKADYTRTEAPYRAKLKSYYADSNETKTRDIEATVSEFILYVFYYICTITMNLGNGYIGFWSFKWQQ